MSNTLTSEVEVLTSGNGLLCLYCTDSGSIGTDFDARTLSLNGYDRCQSLVIMGLSMGFYYWSSTEYSAALAWRIWSEIWNDGVSWGNPYKTEYNKKLVRACLAF